MPFYLVSSYHIETINSPVIANSIKCSTKQKALQKFFKINALAFDKAGLYYINVSRYKAEGIQGKLIVTKIYNNGKLQKDTGIN